LRRNVSSAPQIACEAYDHVEIPEIKPDITRVTLFGGTCPCCAKRFKAPPPQGLEPGSPFGPNLRAADWTHPDSDGIRRAFAFAAHELAVT
jgi:hypothetical protein